MSDTIKAEDLVTQIQKAAEELNRLRKPEWFIIEPRTGIPRTFEYMLENGFQIYDDTGTLMDVKTNEEFEILMIDADKLKIPNYADMPFIKKDTNMELFSEKEINAYYGKLIQLEEKLPSQISHHIDANRSEHKFIQHITENISSGLIPFLIARKKAVIPPQLHKCQTHFLSNFEIQDSGAVKRKKPRAFYFHHCMCELMTYLFDEDEISDSVEANVAKHYLSGYISTAFANVSGETYRVVTYVHHGKTKLEIDITDVTLHRDSSVINAKITKNTIGGFEGEVVHHDGKLQDELHEIICSAYLRSYYQKKTYMIPCFASDYAEYMNRQSTYDESMYKW